MKLIDRDEWIGGSGVADVSVDGDPDMDAIPNLVEYALGRLQGSFDNPAPIILRINASLPPPPK